MNSKKQLIVYLFVAFCAGTLTYQACAMLPTTLLSQQELQQNEPEQNQELEIEHHEAKHHDAFINYLASSLKKLAQDPRMAPAQDPSIAHFSRSIIAAQYIFCQTKNVDYSHA